MVPLELLIGAAVPLGEESESSVVPLCTDSQSTLRKRTYNEIADAAGVYVGR